MGIITIESLSCMLFSFLIFGANLLIFFRLQPPSRQKRPPAPPFYHTPQSHLSHNTIRERKKRGIFLRFQKTFCTFATSHNHNHGTRYHQKSDLWQNEHGWSWHRLMLSPTQTGKYWHKLMLPSTKRGSTGINLCFRQPKRGSTGINLCFRQPNGEVLA